MSSFSDYCRALLAFFLAWIDASPGLKAEVSGRGYPRLSDEPGAQLTTRDLLEIYPSLQ